MILFFSNDEKVYAVAADAEPNAEAIDRLQWLFSEAKCLGTGPIEGLFTGSRREMVTPWSTNAVEITRNMGLQGITRIEEFIRSQADAPFDPMLSARYEGLGSDVFDVDRKSEPVIYIEDIDAYNKKEGLALNPQEVAYLDQVARKMGRSLTDSEVFGFSQVNSEHCRHKIFNGEFVIDGEQMPESLFSLIKKTTKTHPNLVVSAYKDNCAFIAGSHAEQFSPVRHDTSDWFEVNDFESVISLKAETHNFPTTVEPFNGAATGTGGEIRDRIAGGKGSFPVAGTAVYMTSYPRPEGGRDWEKRIPARKWLYRSPENILVKASDGASDFGNKFGQPLLCGSVVTFEHSEDGHDWGYDKVIMLAGGVGYARKQDSLKDEPHPGDRVMLLGGDNYRIGMGGGAVSSVATGHYGGMIELNAVQRSNPEMQKRVYNAIRAISEEGRNPIESIHDHGAGGHLNCLSELVEATGGRIDLDRLPVGDPTLSYREIVGNESQERMGLVMAAADVEHLERIAERERAPIYDIGEATGDGRFTFVDNRTGEKPIDWPLEYMFGSPPKTIMEDSRREAKFRDAQYDPAHIATYIENVLQLENVACKDWLTNKVDRSVTGRVAMQQTAGSIQLPMNDCAVVALDYRGVKGIATSLGHAPAAALADAAAGSELAVAEALANIVFAPLEHGLRGVSLSANWMWPCHNEGEDARLYDAVQAVSDFAIALGINIPTGKDSLSMTQKYPDGHSVMAPGTVIISASAEVSNVSACVTADLKPVRSQIVYIDFSGGDFALGGSAFSQTLGCVGSSVPRIKDAERLAACFGAVQRLVKDGKVLAGHDVSGGGLITALLEMTFGDNLSGLSLNFDALGQKDTVKTLFCERPAVVLQVENGVDVCEWLQFEGLDGYVIGEVNFERRFAVSNAGLEFELNIDSLRDTWYKTSYLLDRVQSGQKKALERYENYKSQELEYLFPENFTGKLAHYGIDPARRKKTGVKAAIIREKGSNGDREMAWAMHLAGMDVKDVHMTDLVSGRETLEEVQLIVFVGGFSNSDVLNSAKGWAGAFLYNEKARAALENFYARPDTLSLGVCNGCQLMIELGLITPQHDLRPKMLHNESHKFESGFVGVDVERTNCVMLSSLAGSSLGVWVAHGEGRFSLPLSENRYNIALKYSHAAYPANPNGSDFATAGMASHDGRHLAVMPHPERAINRWNWPHYPHERREDEVSPWIEMFVNARNWMITNKK